MKIWLCLLLILLAGCSSNVNDSRTSGDIVYTSGVIENPFTFPVSVMVYEACPIQPYLIKPKYFFKIPGGSSQLFQGKSNLHAFFYNAETGAQIGFISW